MSALRKFGLFWYDFIVGDDWVLAAGVVVGLALAALLDHAGSSLAWLALPVVVIAALVVSIRRALPSDRRGDPPTG
jgi:hypothetical protein